MGKLKPLNPAEFGVMADTLSHFLRRLGLTFAEHERAQRSQRANGASKPTVNGAASGKKRPTRRRHPPIDPGAIIGVVRVAGAKGAVAGQIASKLRVDVGRLRPVLWQIRDEGRLRMTGQRGNARYYLPASPKEGRPAGTKGPRTKQVKPAAKGAGARAATPKRADKRARPQQPAS